MISSFSQQLSQAIAVTAWWLTFFKINSCTQGGILSHFLDLMKTHDVEKSLKDYRDSGRLIVLTELQKNYLDKLKARLGVTREIQLAWFDKKFNDQYLAYAEQRKNCKLYNDDMLMVAGSHWPESYPAIIEINSNQVLNTLSGPDSCISHTTKILHEIAHIKRRDGKHVRRELLISFSIHVAFIVAGFFISRKFSSLKSMNGYLAGLGGGYLIGALAGNAYIGWRTLVKEQKTEEMAVRASTAAELNPHMFGDLQGVSCETPYWKLIFMPGQIWHDPPSVNVQKTKRILDYKLKEEKQHQQRDEKHPQPNSDKSIQKSV